jgi:hypothetical protein
MMQQVNRLKLPQLEKSVCQNSQPAKEIGNDGNRFAKRIGVLDESVRKGRRGRCVVEDSGKHFALCEGAQQ